MSQSEVRPKTRDPLAALQTLLAGGVPPERLRQRILEWAAGALAAEAVVWWDVEDDQIVPSAACGRLEMQPRLADRAPAQVQHVLESLAKNEPVVVRTGGEDDEPLPERTIVAVPILQRGQPCAGIECILRGEMSADRFDAVLTLLEQGTRCVEDFLSEVEPDPEPAPESIPEPAAETEVESESEAVIALEAAAETKPEAATEAAVESKVVAETEVSAAPIKPSPRKPAVAATAPIAFESLAYELHRSLLIAQAADVAANDGRLFVGCDRMSVAIRRGAAVRVCAVSGQDQVNHRSEEVRSMEELARAAIEVGEVLSYRGTIEGSALAIEELFARHVELTGARLILAIPLFGPSEKKPRDVKDLHPATDEAPRVVGCLIVEQFDVAELDPSAEERLNLLADHVGAALGNALEHQEVFLLPTRRVLGRGVDWFRGRALAKTLAVLSVLATIAVALVLIPYEYRVEAEGRLMPVRQQRIFAPWDGRVAEVWVESGERVTKDQRLLRIFDDELHAERVAAENELFEKQQSLLSLQTQIDDAVRQGDRKTELNLKGEYQETKVGITGLTEQVRILTAREESLTLVAPFDGVVATFQVEELLKDRPVTRGEMLLEIMDESSEWRLELEVPEHRMGHLLEAVNRERGGALEVDYVLATDANATFDGRLTRDSIATRSEVAGEEGTVVRIHVATDVSQLPDRRIGAEATAKIDCGESSLGYVLFGDVWEFLENFFWM